MKTYNLTDKQVETTLNALAQLPYAQVFDTIDALQIQFVEQAKAEENQNTQEAIID